MPCFATIRANRPDGTPYHYQQLAHVQRGRTHYKKIHRNAGLCFLSLFLVTFLQSLQQDGIINFPNYALYLPSLILLWPNAIILCCGVFGGLIENEDNRIWAGKYSSEGERASRNGSTVD